MPDQMQPALPLPPLAALLAHSDFREGEADAPQMYADFDEPMATEVEMIAVVERNLSHRARTQDRQMCQLTNTEPASYLYALGFVMGLISEGRSHTQ